MVAMSMSVVVGIVNSSLLLVYKDRWGRLHSSDEQVVVIVVERL